MFRGGVCSRARVSAADLCAGMSLYRRWQVTFSSGAMCG